MNKSVAQQQVTAFRRHMQKIGTKARAEGEKNYLKSALRFHGVPVPEIRKAAKKFAKAHPDLDRDGLLTLVTELFTDEHELRTLAIALLEQFVDRLRAEDIRFVEELLRRCEGWAHIDYLAVRVAGSLVQRFKLARRVLARWNRDESFWIRRAGMLALSPGTQGWERGLRSVCEDGGPTGRGEGVLHPEGDRMGTARVVQAATGVDPGLGGESTRADGRIDGTRGLQVAACRGTRFAGGSAQAPGECGRARDRPGVEARDDP